MLFLRVSFIMGIGKISLITVKVGWRSRGGISHGESSEGRARVQDNASIGGP